MRDALRALASSGGDDLDPLLAAAARRVHDHATRRETEAQSG